MVLEDQFQLEKVFLNKKINLYELYFCNDGCVTSITRDCGDVLAHKQAQLNFLNLELFFQLGYLTD